MKTNEAGKALIKSFEACRLHAYRDAVGIWTIGWGHTIGVRPGMVITQAQADRLFDLDITEFEDGVMARLGGATTTENQLSAMVSLAYNIGLGAFARSTVLREHNRGRYRLASAAFMLWIKAGRRTLRGLVRRRNAERRLYAAV